MLAVLIFLTSGLFLGWSLGANDAANVWGTAVGTRMVKFRYAACVCSIFVIIGAVVSGTGASHNLPSFPLVPVSSSQSIVGGVIGVGLARGGRNLNFKIIGKISFGWIATPVIAALIAVVCLYIVQNVFELPVF